MSYTLAYHKAGAGRWAGEESHFASQRRPDKTCQGHAHLEAKLTKFEVPATWVVAHLYPR